MKAIMLAAGLGSRLYGHDDDHPHKSLLRFGGKSLIERHVEILRECGVEELVLVTGFRADSLLAEVARIGAEEFVRSVYNPEYRRGSVVSLWCARRTLLEGDSCLCLDADVLYHRGLIERLIESPHDTCMLLDRDFEAGEEPVKLCIRDGRPVEFRKAIGTIKADFMGEWPGFLKLSPQTSRALVATMQVFVEGDGADRPMEEAIREVMLSGSGGEFGWEDVTGLPWIEIDFPADVARARDIVLPQIEALATGQS
jgi:choline kinase